MHVRTRTRTTVFFPSHCDTLRLNERGWTTYSSHTPMFFFNHTSFLATPKQQAQAHPPDVSRLYYDNALSSAAFFSLLPLRSPSSIIMARAVAARVAAVAALLVLLLLATFSFGGVDARDTTTTGSPPSAGASRRRNSDAKKKPPPTGKFCETNNDVIREEKDKDGGDDDDDDDARFVFVDAPAGRVRGKLQTIPSPRRHGGDEVEVDARAFLGIPFAEPPVGELRFASPVPKRRLLSPPAPPSGEEDLYFDATAFAPACLQLARPTKYFIST